MKPVVCLTLAVALSMATALAQPQSHHPGEDASEAEAAITGLPMST